MFGTELAYVTSESRSSSVERGPPVGRRQRTATTQEVVRPALAVPQVLALPHAAVILFTTLAGRQYRVLAERLNPLPLLPTLTPPPTLVRMRSLQVTPDHGATRAGKNGLRNHGRTALEPGAAFSLGEPTARAAVHTSADTGAQRAGHARPATEQDAYF